TPETAVPGPDPRRGTPGGIRLSVNADIGNSNNAKRRPGRTRRLELQGAHSGWSCPELDFGLVADQDTLYRINSDLTLDVLRTGLTGRPTAYAFASRRAWWSDGVESGSVDMAG